MYRTSIILLSTIAYAAAAPSAFVPRSCNPNFQGQVQTIHGLPSKGATNGVSVWSPNSLSVGAHISLQGDGNPLDQFLVQFTGQPDGSYNFRFEADTTHSTALTAGANGDLTVEVLSLSTSLASQRFTIECDTCASANSFGAHCTIKNPASGLCVVGTYPGETLHLGSCSAPGIYQFQTVA